MKIDTTHIPNREVLICEGCGGPNLHHASHHSYGDVVCLNFWCEHCRDITQVSFREHKGNIFVASGTRRDYP